MEAAIVIILFFLLVALALYRWPAPLPTKIQEVITGTPLTLCQTTGCTNVVPQIKRAYGNHYQRHCNKLCRRIHRSGGRVLTI